MSDLVGNHIVGFPTRRLKCSPNQMLHRMIAAQLLCTFVSHLQFSHDKAQMYPNAWVPFSISVVIIYSTYGSKEMSGIMKNQRCGFQTGLTQKRAVQAQKQARGWKFWI